MNTTTDSVRIVCFDRANGKSFLLLSETDDPENLKLPGGKFNSVTESPETAARRELNEELGIQGNIKLQFISELTNDDGQSKRFIYSCILTKEDVTPSNEISHIIWSTIDTTPECKNKSHIQAAVGACLG